MKTNNMKVREITSEAEFNFRTTFMGWFGTYLGRYLSLGISLIWELNWRYEKTMDALAEAFAAEFTKGAKFKLVYEVNRQYTDMVVAMELKNEFATEG